MILSAATSWRPCDGWTASQAIGAWPASKSMSKDVSSAASGDREMRLHGRSMDRTEYKPDEHPTNGLPCHAWLADLLDRDQRSRSRPQCRIAILRRRPDRHSPRSRLSQPGFDGVRQARTSSWEE